MAVFRSSRFDAYFLTIIAGIENIERVASDFSNGWVGRGIQPPSTPNLHPYTQTYTKSIKNARFSTFRLYHHGRTKGSTDRRTDQRTDQRTKPLTELRVRN